MESRVLKRILLVSALIAGALTSFGSPEGDDLMPVTTSSPKAKALFLEAMAQVFENGDQAKCTGLLKKALEIDPDFALANTWYAFMGVGSIDQEKYLAAALAQADKVSVPEKHFVRSYSAFAKRNYDEAVSEMKAAVEAAPGDRYVLFHMANILGNIGKYSEALEYAKLSSEKDPKFGAALDFQGILLRNLNRPEESEKAFIRAIELNPANTQFLNDYAQLLRSRNRIDEAISMHKKALSIRQDYLSNLFLGHCYVAKDNYPEAREQYLKAKEASSTNGQKSFCLESVGYTYLYEGNLPEALAAFDRMANFDRQSPGMNDQIINADIDKAYSCLLYEEYEKYNRYLADMKEHTATLDLTESDKTLFNMYQIIVEGYLYAYKGDTEKAQLFLERFENSLNASEKNQYKADLMEVKGLIDFHKGNYTEAIANLEQGGTMAQYYAGLAYEKLGNKEKARETYQKISDNKLTGFDLAATKPFARKRLAML
ncbi:MAG: tetratricopeptide repeat protein [Bacteroidota bacterium]|nr:tetratricopeptide repeat protein [Bacteroidota bacterium]